MKTLDAKTIAHYEMSAKIYGSKLKSFLVNLGRWILIVGISYIILGPIITIVSKSFMSIEDAYSPLVFIIPITGTIENLVAAYTNMDYLKMMGNTFTLVGILMILQIMIAAIVGYGFARFRFPFKNLLFAGVILTIIVPTHTIMVPLYTQFRYFDVFNLVTLLTGEEGISLIGSKLPIILLTLTGSGLRSGLYIYIFRQFFRGLPKEIEEAALIDGAGVFKTFATVMLPNARPSIVTVMLFSMVWQYNDTFFASLFMPNSNLVSQELTTLAGYLSTIGKIYDPTQVDLVVNAAILMSILPIILIYVLLQRFFVEGIERSGIVG